jgi:predicted DNA-binding transcriptional regulator YafY
VLKYKNKEKQKRGGFMNTAEKLDIAISEKKTIIFEYDGYERTVEPHLYGILGGHEQLHAYQIRGGSSSGGIPEWRNFKLEKMNNVAVNDEVFQSENSYNPSGANYSEIKRQV